MPDCSMGSDGSVRIEKRLHARLQHYFLGPFADFPIHFSTCLMLRVRARITLDSAPERGARTLACRVATLGDARGREESRPGTHECVRHVASANLLLCKP
jgi:hypothetical protein